ncbi:ribokinase [Alkalihalophilus pseudofirmus]|uniref:ribokinase n=1 Tax=Alkalihalophilus pseudofirmus TaxID=79885 RepID=UPI00095111D1|nr:ribokinase [Alkalihalophilus pseudofirmus]
MFNADVVVYGTINMDLVASVNRFPEIGETISSNEFNEIPGGKAANQAVAAQRLGKQVAFVGKVGVDSYGDFLKGKLAQDGILIEYVSVSATKATGSSIILVDEEGQNIIVTNQNANNELTKEDVDSSLEIAKRAKAVLLQLEMKKDVAEYLIHTFRKLNIPLFLNLAPVVPLDPQLRRSVDFLIVNEIEAEQLTGFKVKDIAEARLIVEKLMAEGHRQVILTLGKEGAVVGEENIITHVESPKVQAVDSTAAGDCFSGALVTYWLEEKNLLEATKKAAVAAAISVTRKGAQPSIPTKSEVEDFIKENNHIF